MSLPELECTCGTDHVHSLTPPKGVLLSLLECQSPAVTLSPRQGVLVCIKGYGESPDREVLYLVFMYLDHQTVPLSTR